MKQNKQSKKNPKSIFANDEYLRDTMTDLMDFLEARPPKTHGRYCCLDNLNEDYDLRWFYTSRFCEVMEIDDDFVPMLIEYVDPPCEGELVNKFSVEEVIKQVHRYREEIEK